MIAMAKKIGRPTCLQASSVTCQVSSGVNRPPFLSSASSQWRITFSVTTIAASTSTPMAMAMPVSDMMLLVMPVSFISRKETRIETGNGRVTIRMLRKCQRNRMWARVTSTTSSSSACLSVSIVRSISVLRS